MVRSVKADYNPFTKAKAYITDAKFYIQKHNVKDESEQPLLVVKIQNPESSGVKGEKVMIPKSKEKFHKKLMFHCQKMNQLSFATILSQDWNKDSHLQFNTKF